MNLYHLIPLSEKKFNKVNPRRIDFTVIQYDVLLPTLFIHTRGRGNWNLFDFKKGRAASHIHIRIRYIDQCIPAYIFLRIAADTTAMVMFYSEE